MSKRSGVFDVQVDVSKLIRGEQKKRSEHSSMTLEKALSIVVRQMQVSGFRERTIKDYQLHWNHFRQITETMYLAEISADKIYTWLGSMEVSNQTKLTRLKCLKALLTKCFDNGWLEQKFWKTINIKVDKNIKKGSASSDIELLLSLLDLNSFVGLRDAVAILTMYRTGVRIKTLGQLEENHIDLENLTLNLSGSIQKNHKTLQLPIDKHLGELICVLIRQNNLIRKRFNENNNFIFITQNGTPVNKISTNNAISKRLNKYSKDFGLQNINPHAIRRAYAKNLMVKGANIALISKALGHANLSVTTQYLELDIKEVSENLRSFL